MKLMNRLAVLAAVSRPALCSPRIRTTMFPPVRGTHEMVGAANNLEVEAGFRMLTQGGNAVDAGVATVLAAAVTEQARFGLGGEMPLLIKMAGKPVVAISGVGVAPGKATVEFYQAPQARAVGRAGAACRRFPAQGILAATVPGVFDGLILALDAVRHHVVRASVARRPSNTPTDSRSPKSSPPSSAATSAFWSCGRLREAFFLPGGAPPERGEIFREPTLAQNAARAGGGREESARQARRQAPGRARLFLQGPARRNASPRSRKATAA